QDALLEVEQLVGSRIDRRVARRDAAHALLRRAVTGSARAPRRPRRRRPQRLALPHPEKGRVGPIVRLHRPRFRRREERAGMRLAGGDALGGGGQRREGEQRRQRPAPHVTVIWTVSVSTRPWSSVQANTSAPLSVATVQK